MKLGKNKLAIALGATLGLGMAGHASADVYGLSSLQVNNLLVVFAPSSTGAGVFSFDTDQNASLNGVADPSDGSASCGGIFNVVNDCGAGVPRLSGTVQNAPGGGLARGENDYTKYGTAAEYSNSEAAILTAALLLDGSTSTSAISESNLKTGLNAAANTNVSSNTLLSLDFTVSGQGTFNINFDAIIDVLAEVTAPSAGIAQANSSLSVTLVNAQGQTLVSWAPTGNESITTCQAGLVCDADEAALSLNNSNTSGGAANRVNGSGNYDLFVTGLLDGNYTLALNTTTSTSLRRINVVPVPGTLLLMGTGLLMGARALRRKQ
jgi:hypothetical protein